MLLCHCSLHLGSGNGTLSSILTRFFLINNLPSVNIIIYKGQAFKSELDDLVEIGKLR